MKICKRCGEAWIYHDDNPEVNTYYVNCKCGLAYNGPYPYRTYEAAKEAWENNVNAIDKSARYCPRCFKFFVAPIKSQYDSQSFITYYESTCPTCGYEVEWDDVYWR